jgi:hypothetical protein
MLRCLNGKKKATIEQSDFRLIAFLCSTASVAAASPVHLLSYRVLLLRGAAQPVFETLPVGPRKPAVRATIHTASVSKIIERVCHFFFVGG